VVAPPPAAWELALDRARKRSPEKPSRWRVFGRAGLRHTKMTWMRRQPDLRMSVVIALAGALEMPAPAFLAMILREQAVLDRAKPRSRASLTRAVVNS